MWWLYFNAAAAVAQRRLELREPHAPAATPTPTCTSLMVAGVIVSAVGDELVIAHPRTILHGAESSPSCAGPAIYLLALALFRLRMAGTLSRKRLGGAPPASPSALVGPLVPRSSLAALLVAILVAVIAAERLRRPAARARGEPSPLDDLVGRDLPRAPDRRTGMRTSSSRSSRAPASLRARSRSPAGLIPGRPRCPPPGVTAIGFAMAKCRRHQRRLRGPHPARRRGGQRDGAAARARRRPRKAAAIGAIRGHAPGRGWAVGQDIRTCPTTAAASPRARSAAMTTAAGAASPRVLSHAPEWPARAHSAAVRCQAPKDVTVYLTVTFAEA